jgi:hypothetical protein
LARTLPCLHIALLHISQFAHVFHL